MKVAILGTGAFGMALASIVYDNGCKIKMWSNSEDEVKTLLQKRKSDKVSYVIPDDIVISTDIGFIIDECDVILIAVPASFIDNVCKLIRSFYKKGQVILIASKGIENDTGRFLNEVVRDNIKNPYIGVISGGTFARDIVLKNPIGLTLATGNKRVCYLSRMILQNDLVLIEVTKDVIGTELCGAIKNVMAIGMGMIHGMGYSDSTKCMFISLFLNDLGLLIHCFGGKEKTLSSFAGIGDFILSCTSEESRNYSLGVMIGSEKEKSMIKDYIDNTTTEGVYTLKSIKHMLDKIRVVIPSIDVIYDIVFNDRDVKDLMLLINKKK